jgi:hypothetical protein
MAVNESGKNVSSTHINLGASRAGGLTLADLLDSVIFDAEVTFLNRLIMHTIDNGAVEKNKFSHA